MLEKILSQAIKSLHGQNSSEGLRAVSIDKTVLYGKYEYRTTLDFSK